MNEITKHYRTTYIDEKGRKKSNGLNWIKTHNLADKYYTCGQVQIDYYYMLDKTIAELRKKITDRPIEILDPCAGRKALEKDYENVNWHLYDLEPETDDTIQADFLDLQIDYKVDLIVCNPPFNLKRQFVKKCMELCDNIILIAPVNAIPYYEYSLKRAYSLDFKLNIPVGIWHYDASKNNKDKYIGPNYRKPIESRLIRTTYDEYMKLRNKERYLCWTGCYYYADTRISKISRANELTAPSLLDCNYEKEDLVVNANDGIYKEFDPLNRDCWASKITANLIKKGQLKNGYLLKLKDGITVADVAKYYEDNREDMILRSITQHVMQPSKGIPFTEEECQKFFVK